VKEITTLRESDLKELFRKSDNFFIAVLSIEIFLFLFVYFFVDNIALSVNFVQGNEIILSILPTSALVIIARKLRTPLKNLDSLELKLLAFVRRAKKTMLLLLLAQLLNSTLYFFLPRWEFLAIMALITLLHIGYRPTKTNLIRNYKLDEKETSIVNSL